MLLSDGSGPPVAWAQPGLTGATPQLVQVNKSWLEANKNRWELFDKTAGRKG